MHDDLEEEQPRKQVSRTTLYALGVWAVLMWSLFLGSHVTHGGASTVLLVLGAIVTETGLFLFAAGMLERRLKNKPAVKVETRHRIAFLVVAVLGAVILLAGVLGGGVWLALGVIFGTALLTLGTLTTLGVAAMDADEAGES